MVTARIGSETYEFFGELERYFYKFRKHIIGENQTFLSPYGRQRIVYADWTASGRLYRPIENKITDGFGPFFANTHTESNVTSTATTLAYQHAQKLIKAHVNADKHDAIIMDGSGMTAVICKLQRILGLRLPDKYRDAIHIPEAERPVIFVTHMEHHSNHTSWLETIGDVVVMEPNDSGLVSPEKLEELLRCYAHRTQKIGSFTACSNVTGIQTPYYQLARKMHEYGGICLVDFSASAPYVDIDMHPPSPQEKLDGIFFSPHKFLGGPGSCGILIFDSRLYSSKTPDKPGGGTVWWTNPWGDHLYITDVEIREDGGTPGILQAIKAALAVSLKEEVGTENIQRREKELVEIVLSKLSIMPKLHVLDGNITERLGIISFCVENVHYNLVAKLLNDRFGFQVRGGCSCADTYGHYLLNINKETSKFLMGEIDKGDFSQKPGWVRFSMHPTMTNQEVYSFIAAIQLIIQNIKEWEKDYVYDSMTNDFYHIDYMRANMNTLFKIH